MKRFRIVYVCFFVGVLFSCKTDEPPKPATEVKMPTPVSLQKPSEKWPGFTIPADNQLTAEGISLGRMLFYEPMLSGNNTQSCSSCHGIVTAFSDTVAFSKGAFGQTGNRNAMPLFNLLWSSRMFWDGRAASLEDQALRPIQDPLEMDETLTHLVSELQASPKYPALFKKAFLTDQITPRLIAKALAQFERTIISAGSKFDKSNNGLTLSPSEKRGMQIFNGEALQQIENPSLPPGGDCFHCHGNPGSVLFTNLKYMNNGLDAVPDSGYAVFTKDPFDIGKFKVPSLRNLKFTGPYMHDGRFKTLQEVIAHYNNGAHYNSPNIDPNIKKHEGKSLGLAPQDVQDLINFLNTLNDDDFMKNPDLANPFL